MMFNPVHRAALTIAVSVALAGCMSARSFPTAVLSRTVFFGAEGGSDASVRADLQQRVILPPTPRAAILWVDEIGGSGNRAVPLPESERTRLLAAVTRSLEQGPFSAVVNVPTTRVPGAGELDLNALRATAARFQADVMILLLTRHNGYDDWNVLAATYPVLLPMLFVPGHDVAAYVSAEMCALDVRTGIFLACAEGHGDDSRRFVTMPRRDRRLRELTVEATEAALVDIGHRLNDAVAARIGEPSDRLNAAWGGGYPDDRPPIPNTRYEIVRSVDD
jgi:hypothetical protein